MRKLRGGTKYESKFASNIDIIYVCYISCKRSGCKKFNHMNDQCLCILTCQIFKYQGQCKFKNINFFYFAFYKLRVTLNYISTFKMMVKGEGVITTYISLKFQVIFPDFVQKIYKPY